MIHSTGGKHVPRLPACQSCYTKKIKCDNARPKCMPCVKSGHACFTVSLGGTVPVSREYIYELEQHVQGLQTEMTVVEGQEVDRGYSHSTAAVTESPTPTRPERHNQAPEPSIAIQSNDVISSPSITEGVGISFMSLLFADARWRDQNLKLLQNLSQSSGILETSVQPNSLPPAEEALAVFNNYLNVSHVQNPFLLRRDVQRLYHSVFSTGQTGPSSQIPDHLTKHDAFRTFMILAVGSVMLYRSGAHKHHPYGYFLTALQYIDTNILSRGLDSIQDLLFVARFGIYHHIGTSIWELTTLFAAPGLWECYMISQYSSITLDRPAAIADRDIQVGLPADADDQEIDAAEASGSFSDLDSFCRATTRPTTMGNTEMTVGPPSNVGHAWTMDSITASGRIYADLEELLSELEEWRRSAPMFSNPRGLYHTQEWYDLLLLRERLLLVRKAIDLVPKRNNIPPGDLLLICLEYAVGTITKFCPLFEQGKITYTRSYFQMLFTAGLSVMLWVSVASNHDTETMVKAADAVKQSEKALKQMGREMPDATPYVSVYEALQVHVLGKYNVASRTTQQTGGYLGQTQSQYTGMDGMLHNQNTTGEYHSVEQNPSQFGSHWPPLLNDLGTHQQLDHEPSTYASLLSRDLFGDNTFWNVEVGLGEYAYGDPMFLFSGIADDSI
ncbi:Zn(II)2Cys6 transcription factor [Aspergillus nomiae NRRL 13137]|uniref:Zn(II)2Cys6 transcription factor n=2 Tax=Aspergillus subgen. Circumdati TaxID=2720871 RepID=A0A0L1IMT3_ASPN3|nr:Zn(II)2Cys6 transcription factor [Aspergillus nomiae NRRL 13137]KNG80493.1 Zn(II)2Cys6 transcription factor [Aspergillus nomiae NRRL 13137]